MNLPHDFNTPNFWLFSSREEFSYLEYLEHKSHSDTVVSQLQDNACDMIASQTELAEMGYRITQEETRKQTEELSNQLNIVGERMSDAVSAIGVELSEGFQSIERSIDNVNYTIAAEGRETRRTINNLSQRLDFHFSNVLLSIGGLSNNIEQLIQIAKTPTKTWALEQFDMARDAMRRGLYEDSIELVDRAIDGYKNQTGDRLEHRFHLLKGSLLLGCYDTRSHGVVNLEDSLSSFEKAARFAEGVSDEDVSFALTLAGHNRLFCNQAEKAVSYLSRAQKINPFNANASFDMARAQAQLGNNKLAIENLAHSITVNPSFALKAGEMEFNLSAKGQEIFISACRIAQNDLRKITKKYSDEGDDLFEVYEKNAPISGEENTLTAVKSKSATIYTMWSFIQSNGYKKQLYSAARDAFKNFENAKIFELELLESNIEKMKIGFDTKLRNLRKDTEKLNDSILAKTNMTFDPKVEGKDRYFKMGGPAGFVLFIGIMTIGYFQSANIWDKIGLFTIGLVVAAIISFIFAFIVEGIGERMDSAAAVTESKTKGAILSNKRDKEIEVLKEKLALKEAEIESTRVDYNSELLSRESVRKERLEVNRIALDTLSNKLKEFNVIDDPKADWKRKISTKG